MRMPTFYVSHGGGPWPWMTDMKAMCAKLDKSLRSIPGMLPEKPKAVLLITAHWEGSDIEISAGKQPGMLYDYGGFPPETYKIQYPAPGSPEIAQSVAQRLQAAGIRCKLDTKRGYDHGTFVPMAVMYPKADMPLVQMSILQSYDPARHAEIGRALAPLRDEGIAIVASGVSFHNLRQFGPAGKEPSQKFDQWLRDAVLAAPGPKRTAAVSAWEKAPHARFCHPQEDHLVPIFVAMGAAENDPATCIYNDLMMGTCAISSFRFG
ncbi:Extradiol ring-cleavage dioxygenase [Diplonema papillatum]|nr:Extradiol ring-cleavage dioxygenase [Diplonema papillatum]